MYILTFSHHCRWIPWCADTVMSGFAFSCLYIKNTTWLWTRNTTSMLSVAWMEVMLLSTAFAYSRGRCCAVTNYLEVSFRTFRDFIYTAVERERERERGILFHEVSFIGRFVAEPETGPLLCRTVLWDCFKDTNTSFIGSVCHFRKSKTAQKCQTTQHRSIK